MLHALIAHFLGRGDAVEVVDCDVCAFFGKAVGDDFAEAAVVSKIIIVSLGMSLEGEGRR
jgi:hypothetical protein